MTDPAPRIELTDAAAERIRATMLEAGEDALRVRVDADFAAELRFDSVGQDDVRVEAGGIVLVLDRESAARADGLTIDFVPGPESGFHVRHPSVAAPARPLAPGDLKAMLDGGEQPVLIDVRTDHERTLARLDGADALDDALWDRLGKNDDGRPIVFFCHLGPRGEAAAAEAVRRGLAGVHSLTGGIDGWSLLVDPSVPRYGKITVDEDTLGLHEGN